jgi:flagellar basal-body rod protein FlgB
MFGKPEILSAAGALSRHASALQRAVAENVANADTPGYRARDVSAFQLDLAGNPDAMRATRAGHLGAASEPSDFPLITRKAPDSQSANGNSVSLEGEMVRATDARRENDVALAVYKTSLEILRASLGRR